MDAATALITALAGKGRFVGPSSRSSSIYKSATDGRLCHRVVVCVTYLGPFNKEFGDLLMQRDFYGDLIKRDSGDGEPGRVQVFGRGGGG